MTEDDDLHGVPRLGDAELVALLSDPSLWEEPSPDLEARVVAAVATGMAPPVVVTAPRRRRRWLTPAATAVLGAAAAALVAFAAWPNRTTEVASGPGGTPVVMKGTDLAPEADGTAAVKKLGSGWAISIAIPDLPWREGTDFYQVWVRDCAKQYLVPAGSFHDLKKVVAWAGVSLDEFPVITVTRETLAPNGPGQASSGEVVASGELHPCP